MFQRLLFLLPALAFIRPAHAQTQLFNEQFDTPSRWSTATRSAANVAQYKGSDWLQYPPLGNIAPTSFNLVNTEWGNKLVQMSGDGAEGRYLRFKLSTYNPNNYRANRASKFLWGAEMQTLRKFGPPAPGHAIEFESRLRLPSLFPSMTGSFYTYSQKQSNGTVFSDELDFEYLGARLGNEVQLVSWNDFGRRNDGKPIPSQGAGTGFELGVTGQGGVVPNGVNRADWHLLKFRWICDSPGVYRVEFCSKQLASDTYRVVYTASRIVPNDAMEIHLNIWASDNSLTPTAAPGADAIMDVDWCRVTDVLVDANAARKSKAKPSGGRS